MKTNVVTILDVTSNTTGQTKEFPRRKTIQVVVTGTVTVVVEVSNDGITFEPLLTTAANWGGSDDKPWKYLRAVSSGMSGATAKVYIGHTQ